MDLSRYHATRIDRPSPGEIAQMIRDGETIEDLAATFGCAASTIRHELAAAGYNSRTGKPRTTVDDDLAALADIPFPGAWVADALCAQVDPELFFPAKGGSTAEAKAVCRRCPVAADCLDYALAFPVSQDQAAGGIWGGTSERERRRLRKTPHQHQDAS